jgi:hypothetical protein
MVNGKHPWLLTGPWYRWPDPHDPNSGRFARPVFQKSQNTSFVMDFLKDPQKSLKFVDPIDFVHKTQKRQPPLPPFERDGQQYTASLSANVSVRTDTRKIFLDVHRRFYLVVCELHCDEPGLPNVNREQVCEAGLVVRRRIAKGPAGSLKRAARGVRDVARARQELAQFAEMEALPPGMRSSALLGYRAAAQQRFTAASAKLEATALELGITLELQGWAPDPRGLENLGSWTAVPETPSAITESIFPLYPLIPDPQIQDHSSGGRTIYFGVLPTGSADVDVRGGSRFDDRTLYEIRCFVRRHNPKCPKKTTRSDCKGEIVWSLRTEGYQLANPFDLVGTSNRPINIYMPDLPALEAQAAALAPGQGAPVRMISPADSNLEVNVDPSDVSSVSEKGRGAAICSFSIPLITIVATFVFKLFLPIVTFVFGLWFLLKLKFCIPPSLEFDAAVELSAAISGKLDFEASASISVSLHGEVLAALEADLGTAAMAGSAQHPGLNSYAPGVTGSIALSDASDFSADVPEGVEVDASTKETPKASLVAVDANLEFEDRVEVNA